MIQKNNIRLQNCIGFVRQEKNMTQEQLAEASGVSRNTISSIECGRHVPSILHALMIADALDVDVYDIFSYNLKKS